MQNNTTPKNRAPRNRTLTLTDDDRAAFSAQLLRPDRPLTAADFENRIINADFMEVAALLPEHCVDLAIVDPPYSIAKDFHGLRFGASGFEDYLAYLESWLPLVIRTLKPDGSLYLCGDWQCSAAGYLAMRKFLKVRGRIVWQREKGRGAARNWKNCTEDIWFGTVSDDYYFDAAAVKLRRRVIAPYRENGKPKDWVESRDGNYRLTFASNFWDDISIPFWSMPENTDHPTQKPEKLLAKLILASSAPGGLVFDPFLGSGTTAVAAKKLGRRFAGVEINTEYCCWAQARLQRAGTDPAIQGYENGVFLERNTRQ
ncbi:MAG: site-specific DNA-methyltransferase [Victivallaceae bacterium]